MTNSRRAVRKAEDFDGIKLRVMQSSLFIDTFKTLGANPTPMAFGEVFTSLETRTIDGQENPFATIETAKLYEVQKYLSVTRHVYSPFFVLYSKKLWDQLNPQEQAALREAALAGQAVQRDASRSQDAQSLAALKTRGMQVDELSAEEKARIIAKLKPVYDKHVPVIGTEAVNVLLDALKKVRGG
jgi:TRAP-type C4-dicarboxylate transport system substrate-binding protein